MGIAIKKIKKSILTQDVCGNAIAGPVDAVIIGVVIVRYANQAIKLMQLSKTAWAVVQMGCWVLDS